MALISLFGVIALFVWFIAVRSLPQENGTKKATTHSARASSLLKYPLTWMITFFFWRSIVTVLFTFNVAAVILV